IQRAEENGLTLYAAIGVHPRSISTDYINVIEKLPELLINKNVVALGEIGLETASEVEINVFKQQLKIAQDMGIKVIVHTPRTNKKEITNITASIIEDNIETSLIQLDHINLSIIDRVDDFEGILGITVQPQKMTPEEAVSLMEEYGYDRFVLDSDISSSPSDPLSVPKTVHKLRLAGIGEKNIKKVSYTNVSKFLGI
ncbi:MAG: TatD family hydrolase, partial [Methanobacterium sp.]|nr:TatD family hydrolase [Methanobacterium sp.]